MRRRGLGRRTMKRCRRCSRTTPVMRCGSAGTTSRRDSWTSRGNAVQDADSLVAETMQQLANTFARERGNLEQQWGRGDNVSTEDPRIAFRRYRSFFKRLLSVAITSAPRGRRSHADRRPVEARHREAVEALVPERAHLGQVVERQRLAQVEAARGRRSASARRPRRAPSRCCPPACSTRSRP